MEDWLIAKNGDAKDVSLRIVPRKIVREAYKHAIQTVEGKGKNYRGIEESNMYARIKRK